MRILIVDAQVFHTPALHRGMGKYSLELLENLIQSSKKEMMWDKVELIVSSRLPLSEEAEALLREKAHGANIIRLDLKRDLIFDALKVGADNRKVIDQYIAPLLLEEDIKLDYLILSPMQGGITSVFPSDPQIQKALICYDLIPFMYHEIYFRNSTAKLENLTKLGELLKADTFLTISKTVANDLATYLGVDASRIYNIDGGPINHSDKPKSINVPEHYILMPTGNDLRKNNRAGILGFGEFNKAHSNKYSLVITSFFDPDQVTELSQLAPNILFTGNISGSELDYLYTNCDAVLFPSEYEGLGLPVLEGVQKSKPIACSDIAVFREMSKTAFCYFDQSYGTSIARALNIVIEKQVNVTEYKKILDKYSWKNTAEATIVALKPGFKKIPIFDGDKPSVLFFGVNPETLSPEGRILQRTYAELSRLVKPSYFLYGEKAKFTPRADILSYVSEAAFITQTVALNLDKYDAIVYNISNSKLSSKALFAALSKPGVVVLYDLMLNQAWKKLFDDGFIDEARLRLEEKIQSTYCDENSNLLGSLLARQHGVAVFSNNAKHIVDSILKRMKINIPVNVITYPLGHLVYPDTIPAKNNSLIAIGVKSGDFGFNVFKDAAPGMFKKFLMIQQNYDNDNPLGFDNIMVKSDRQFEDILSRTNLSFCISGDSLLDALEAIRYGTIPMYLSGKEKLALDIENIIEKITDTNGLEQRLTYYTSDNEAYTSDSNNLVSLISHANSYTRHASDLVNLIEQTLGSKP